MELGTQAQGLRASRRNVVRGAAWSVPVVAVASAAPAFAASYCPTVTLNWANFAAGSTFTSASVGGVTVSLTVSGATGATNNRTISSVATGAQSNNLRFYSAIQANSAQTATFSFTRNNQPVNVLNLAFSFLDIDSGNTWFDQVSVGTTGYQFSVLSSANVIGNGAAATPFRPANANTSGNTPGSSTNGNVDVTWPIAVSQVSFTYSQGVTPAAVSAPFIGISNISFQPNC